MQNLYRKSQIDDRSPESFDTMYLPEIENSVLCTMVFNPGLIASQRGKLNPAAFSAKHIRFLETLYRMFDESTPVNKPSIQSALNEVGQINPAHNAILANASLYANVAGFSDSCLSIQTLFQKRALKSLLSTSFDLIDEAGSIEGFLMSLEDRMRDITTQEAEASFKTIHSAAMEAIDEGIKNRTGKRTSTGYSDLDYLVGGFLPGDLWFIVAPTGTGKTTIAMDLLGHASDQVPVGLFSLEVEAARLALKVLAKKTGISRRNLLFGKFDENDSKIAQTVTELEGKEFYIIDNSFTITELEDKMAILAVKFGVKVLAIDYLGLIEHTNIDDLKRYLNKLKQVAKKFKITVIILIQTNKLRGQKPTEDDMNYIQMTDADVFMGSYEDKYNDENPPRPFTEEGVYNIIWDIRKNRTLGDKAELKRIYDNRRDKYYANRDDWEMDQMPVSSGSQVITKRGNTDDLPF